jgi:hypothetical protein
MELSRDGTGSRNHTFRSGHGFDPVLAPVLGAYAMRNILAAICLSFLLIGCDANGAMPPIDMVEANIPTALRQCPNMPKSPGSRATNRQTAQYIVKLHRVAQECRRRSSEVDKLLVQYQGQIDMYKNAVAQAAK